MAYVPLVEHERPRIMLLDFSSQDVEKFRQSGFETKRGATGVHPNDRDEFLFPYPVQDVEVVFAHVQDGSFAAKRVGEIRSAQSGSVESQPFFKDLFREVWSRAGWIVFFVSQDCPVQEFDWVGIEYLGVLAREKDFYPAAIIHALQEERERDSYGHRHQPEIQLPLPQTPRFSGHALVLNDKEPESEVLQRYIKNARKSVLSCAPYRKGYDWPRYVVLFGEKEDVELLAWDTSTNRSAVAIKLKQSVFAGQSGRENIYHEGGMLFLPDFGAKNADVALALMQEVIPSVSPHLFDAPQHSWLECYQPALVLQLDQEKEEIIEEARQRIQDLDLRAEELRKTFAWLPGLLVHTGDEFAGDVAEALRHLGFEVDEVDSQLQPKERRKEDFHIRHLESGYFAIGEAKTTGKGRGASEEFISKTQTHQNRYARERKEPPPRALLFVNYAIDLEPSRRGERFYQSDLRERLEDNAITAVDSVALWELCQAAGREEITVEQARAILTSGEAFIRSGAFNSQ